ncbi:MAG: RluA family pseudouridine synthase [bacterium]|jgi:RluA family pseudouridine synthase
MFEDTVTFRYRYDYDPMNLKQFIQDRYIHSSNPARLEEIFPSRIQVNGSPVFDDTIINTGDTIEYKHHREDEKNFVFTPQVIYEDENILAISKPDHVPVSPSGPYYYNSLAIRIKEFCNTNDISPLHRLDLETTGVLLFGKSRRVRGKLQPLFEKKKVKKEYQAVTFNTTTPQIIEGDIVPAENSRIYTKLVLVPSENPNSKTHVDRIEPWGEYSRMWIRPVTGKTNQIRVHLADIGCPIVGDKKFYPDEEVYLDWIDYRDMNRIIDRLKLSRHALHCEKMILPHPFTKELIEFKDTNQLWEEKISPLLSPSSKTTLT